MRGGILAIGVVAIVVGCISFIAADILAVETVSSLGTPVKTANPYLLYLGLGVVLFGALLFILGIATSKKVPGAERPPTPAPAEEEVDVGKILKRSFKSLVDSPGFIFLYLLPFLVVLIAFVHVCRAFGTLTPWTTIQSSANLINLLSSWWIWIVIYGVAALFLFLVAVAAITSKAGAQARGEDMGLDDALGRGVSRVLSLFAASILGGVIIVGPIFLFIGVALFAPVLILPAVLVLLLWILPAFYIAVRLSLFIPACVLEGLGPVACLKRSWGITKGNFWLIFVIGFLLGIVSTVLGQIPQVGFLVAMIVVGPPEVIAYTLLFVGLKKQAKQSPAAEKL